MAQQIRSETVHIGPDRVPGYLARPADGDGHPGVLVGFEMFGLTDYVRDLVERIAALGYVALAPDFYHRFGPGIELSTAERERGLRMVAELTRADVLADLSAAREFLRDEQAVTGDLGAVGFSFGGHLAYLAATELDIAATAVFYGGWLTSTGIALGQPEPTLARTGRIRGRVLFLVGDQDHAVPADDVRQIEESLAAHGIAHEVVVYPDTPHGFFADQRDSYRPQVAADAWQRTTALLATLRSAG